jgi:hypothetical protein
MNNRGWHSHTGTAKRIQFAYTVQQQLRSTVACIVQHKGGVRMSYSLAAAATATGLSKVKLLRAIKNGKITGTKDEHGEWLLDPAELHLVYPPIRQRSAGDDAALGQASPDVEALGAQIEALLRRAGDRLRQQIAEVRGDYDTGHDQGQASQLLIADQHERLP